jgi:hypothetical protein
MYRRSEQARFRDSILRENIRNSFSEIEKRKNGTPLTESAKLGSVYSHHSARRTRKNEFVESEKKSRSVVETFISSLLAESVITADLFNATVATKEYFEETFKEFFNKEVISVADLSTNSHTQFITETVMDNLENEKILGLLKNSEEVRFFVEEVAGALQINFQSFIEAEKKHKAEINYLLEKAGDNKVEQKRVKRIPPSLLESLMTLYYQNSDISVLNESNEEEVEAKATANALSTYAILETFNILKLLEPAKVLNFFSRK